MKNFGLNFYNFEAGNTSKYKPCGEILMDILQLRKQTGKKSFLISSNIGMN